MIIEIINPFVSGSNYAPAQKMTILKVAPSTK
jgi:hypothetical protein